MNDLIKKLGLQACDLAGEPDEIDDDKEYFAVTKEFMEKFAELIVRECAERFAAEPDRPFYGRHVANQIRKHFGVEE